MARKSKDQKDRTSIVISTVIHVILIGGIGYWAYKSGALEDAAEHILKFVRSETKPKEPPKPVPPKAEPPKPLPPINQGVAPQPRSTGVRQATDDRAPDAPGGNSFFVDTRKQVKDPSAAGAGGPQKEAPKVIIVKQAPPPPPVLLKGTAPSTVKALLSERAKAAASVESFGSEQISKSSVSDAGEIVSKVSGASVVDGKYAVIRGLTDRYSAATLNGAELPSADPYRRSAALDMFPAKIIDRVSVTKTFTPDQPGSFTGGNINIVTKSFPEKRFFSLELGGGYNTQSSLNEDFLTYDGGGRDWLGMDDGTRALPPELSDFNLVIPSKPSSAALGSAAQGRAEELNRLTEALGPTQFAPTTEKSPLNHNFVLAGGDTTYFLGRPVGVFASLPYTRSYSFYDDGTVERHTYASGSDGGVEIRKGSVEARGVTEVNWAATAAVAYQPFEDHEFRYSFLFNQYSEDVARVRRGFDNDLGEDQVVEQNRLQFTERNLATHQFKGAHVFPESLFFLPMEGVKFDWLLTLSQTTQDEPNARFYNTANGEFGSAALPDPRLPTRYYRELEENNRNLKFDWTVPFRQWDFDLSEFKFGLFDSFSEREFDERIFSYDADDRAGVGNPNNFLTPDTLGYVATTNGNRVTYAWPAHLAQPLNKSIYSGEQKVQAGYLMLDMPAAPWLRVIGGVRYETTDLEVTSFGTVPTVNVPAGQTNVATIKENFLLPAASLVFALSSNMSVRVSYGQTIARPSFRELAGIRSYDPVLDETLEGNPNLLMSEIKNYDVRWEWFPRPGEIFSVALFYKDLKNVIERKYLQAQGDIVTFDNQPKGKVYGVEFETRKSLDFLDHNLRNFSFAGNLSLIKSETELRPEDRAFIGQFVNPPPKTRPLADQSPYIINLDLSYDNPSSGTTVSLSYNVFGPRLLIASLNSPDVYEQPAPSLDFVVSQRIGRHMRLKAGIRNILNPKVEKTYGEDSQAIYSSSTRGITFGMSLAYEF